MSHRRERTKSPPPPPPPRPSGALRALQSHTAAAVPLVARESRGRVDICYPLSLIVIARTTPRTLPTVTAIKLPHYIIAGSVDGGRWCEVLFSQALLTDTGALTIPRSDDFPGAKSMIYTRRRIKNVAASERAVTQTP